MFCAVSRAPLAKIQAYKRRRSSIFPWASSYGSDFNVDFAVAASADQQHAGMSEYDFGPYDLSIPDGADSGPLADWAGESGTDWATYALERPGMSTFVREDDIIYHTYSTYARGLDGLWGMYQWLDRAPLGRNEDRGPDDPLNWFRRHDEYDAQTQHSHCC